MSDIPNESEDDKQKIKQLEEQVATLSRANETLTTVYQLELLEKDDKIAKLEAALAKKATGQGTSREANTASNVVVGGETAQQPNLSVVPYKNPNVPSGNSASFGFESLCENYISPKTPFPDYAMNYLIEGNNESSSNLQSFPTQQPQLPNQQQVMPYVHGGTSIVYEGTSRPISYLYNTAAQFYGISSPSIRPKPNFNAREVAEFLRGFITDNGCEKKYIMNVMETIISCNNSQRLEFLSVYQQMFNANLFDQLKLKGYFADIIKALMMDTIYLDAYELHRQVFWI
uniref:Uncharacterized protein n=1 Tax=Meloidogyne hapla TaxID=6305 RepID=A0A1I8B6Z3_MELHA